jgi:hypothetical protein
VHLYLWKQNTFENARFKVTRRSHNGQQLFGKT